MSSSVDKQVESDATEDVCLLEDAPSTEDRFEGNAHATLARAISHLVRTEAGGRAIGLEGSWGSGKSTVVTLIASELEANSGSSEVAGSKERSDDARLLIFGEPSWNNS